MVKIKSMATITANYTASAARAGTDYGLGIQGVDWATPAASQNAETNYGAGVQAAVAAGTRAKMIQKAGNQKWFNASNTKGKTNIVTGITQGGPAQAAGYQPFHDAIQGATLPDRTLDPMTNLTQRAGAIVQLEVNLKKQIQGSA